MLMKHAIEYWAIHCLMVSKISINKYWSFIEYTFFYKSLWNSINLNLSNKSLWDLIILYFKVPITDVLRLNKSDISRGWALDYPDQNSQNPEKVNLGPPFDFFQVL